MVVCGVCGSEVTNGQSCSVCEADRKSKLFYSSKLEDKPKADIITIRLNPEERAKLEIIKRGLDVAEEGTALKELAFNGFNVIQATFSPDFLKWLVKKDRPRLSDRKRI